MAALAASKTRRGSTTRWSGSGRAVAGEHEQGPPCTSHDGASRGSCPWGVVCVPGCTPVKVLSLPWHRGLVSLCWAWGCGSTPSGGGSQRHPPAPRVLDEGAPMGATGAGDNGGFLACDKLPGVSDLGTASSPCLTMSLPRRALTQVSRPTSRGTWGPMGVTGDWGKCPALGPPAVLSSSSGHI